jgi:hypothetical protein
MNFRKREKRKILKSYLTGGTNRLCYRVVGIDRIRMVSIARGHSAHHIIASCRYPLGLGPDEETETWKHSKVNWKYYICNVAC